MPLVLFSAAKETDTSSCKAVAVQIPDYIKELNEVFPYAMARIARRVIIKPADAKTCGIAAGFSLLHNSFYFSGYIVGNSVCQSRYMASSSVTARSPVRSPSQFKG